MTSLISTGSNSWKQQYSQDVGDTDWSSVNVTLKTSNLSKTIIAKDYTTTTSARVLVENSIADIIEGDTLFFVNSAGASASKTVTAADILNYQAGSFTYSGSMQDSVTTVSTPSYNFTMSSYTCARFSPNGKKLYLMGAGFITEWECTTPFDFSTAYNTFRTISGLPTDFKKFDISVNGKFIYCVHGRTSNTITFKRITLPTPWSLQDADTSSAIFTFGVSLIDTDNEVGLQISKDGTILYAIRAVSSTTSSTRVYRYTLNEIYGASIISDSLEFDADGDVNSPWYIKDLFVTPAGKFLVGRGGTFNTTDFVFEARSGSSSTAYSDTTIDYDDVYFIYCTPDCTKLHIFYGQGTNHRIVNLTDFAQKEQYYTFDITSLGFAQPPAYVFNTRFSPSARIYNNYVRTTYNYNFSNHNLTKVSSTPTTFVGTGAAGMFNGVDTQQVYVFKDDYTDVEILNPTSIVESPAGTYTITIPARTYSDYFLVYNTLVITTNTGTVFSTLGSSATVTDVKFNNDGTRFFVLENEILYQYSLPTPYKIDNANLDTQYNFNSLTNARKFLFSTDGTLLYIFRVDLGAATASPYSLGINEVTQFVLTTPFDISTITTSSTVYSSVNPGNLTPLTIAGAFSLDGSKYFELGISYNASNNGNGTTDVYERMHVDEFTLSTPFSVSTRTLIDTKQISNILVGDNISFSTSPETKINTYSNERIKCSLSFSSDGKNMYIMQRSLKYYKLTLTTPWSLSSITTTLADSNASSILEAYHVDISKNGRYTVAKSFETAGNIIVYNNVVTDLYTEPATPAPTETYSSVIQFVPQNLIFNQSTSLLEIVSREEPLSSRSFALELFTDASSASNIIDSVQLDLQKFSA